MKLRHNQPGTGGIALMLLVVLGMIATIAGATILFVNRQYNQTVQQEQEEIAFHVAEAGVNAVVFGLNEAVYTTELLIMNGSLEGEVNGTGNYELSFAAVEGSQPGQQIRVHSRGYNQSGAFCQAVEVRIHRTDDALEQFVVDFWNHLPSCDSLGSSSNPTSDPSSTPDPSGSVTPIPSPTISCDDDAECPSGSCDVVAGTCNNTCTDDLDCAGGKCNPLTNACDTDCSSDTDCPSGTACTGDGYCGPLTCVEESEECAPITGSSGCVDHGGGTCFQTDWVQFREVVESSDPICPVFLTCLNGQVWASTSICACDGSDSSPDPDSTPESTAIPFPSSTPDSTPDSTPTPFPTSTPDSTPDSTPTPFPTSTPTES